MEQKFTFKRLLSLLVVFTMLFGSFAALAVPAGAVDVYWAEGDYTIDGDGNMTAANAYDYVFDIAGVNVAPNETNTIFTSDETWKTTNGWAVSVVLENIADDVYEVVTVYNAPALNGDWKSYVTALTEDQIVMMAHSSGSKPNAAGDYSETATIDYANWQDKVAALALKAGDRITFAGVDLEAGTATEATATVQDAPIVVTGENGKWQSDAGTFGFTYDYYTTKDNLVVIATLDGELVAANAEDTTGNGKATNVRLWVNYGAEKWDRLYDGYIKGDAAALYSKDSAGTEGTEGTVALNEKTFTFTLPLDELAGGKDEFQFTICVSNTTAYNEGNACLYAPCDTFAWSAWDAANAHTIVVATSEPTPDPEPDVPTESKNVALNKEYEISGCGTTYAQYTASLTDGAAKTTISYDANWFTFYNNGSDASIINAPGGVGYVIIDLTESYDVTAVKANVIDLQGASGIKGPKSVKAYLSADGETWGEAVELDLSAFVSASESFVAVANIEGEAQFVKVEFELDGIFAFVNEIEVYADVPVEEEPTPDPEVDEHHDILVSHVNAYTWGVYNAMVITGEGENCVSKLGYNCEWWYAIKVDEVDGLLTVTAIEAPSSAVKVNTASADGFILYVFSNDAASYTAAGLVEVGDVLLECDFDWTKGAASETAIGTMSFGPAPVIDEGLTIEIDDTLVGWIGDAADLDAIEAGLTDGNWGAGDAGDWTNASGIYPFMNKVPTDGTQHPEVTLLYNFGEATDVNVINLGVYSSYNVMIGYPATAITVYTSNNGLVWSEGIAAELDLDAPAIGNEGSVKAVAYLPEAVNAKYVKVVLTFPDSPFEDKVVWEFMGLTEVEITYEESYKEGLTVEIDDTLVGWIGDAADLEAIEGGLTDGNWGAGDAGDWTNASGIYPFMNKVPTDGTQHPEVNLIYNFGEATDVNTINLGVYSSYNVMIGYPSNLITVYTSSNGFEWSEGTEAYLTLDAPEIGKEGSVKTTLHLAEVLNAQYVKVVLTFPDSPFEDKVVWEFMGLTEVEITYEESYKEGLTVEIDDTLVGWIGDAADLEAIEGGLTDGNWGAGDAGDWTNASGIYPFMNKVPTDGTQHPEVNLIYNFGEATDVNTIKLGVYSSYNVMIGYPSNLITVYTSTNGFDWSEGTEAYLTLDAPEIGKEGSVTTTLTLAETLNAQYVKVVLTFPDSPFEDKVVWEFMGLTEIELDYIPITSNVVTDWNPTGYKASYGGATGAFIYDDADIYAACGNDWWIHVAFTPVADMDGYYEVVAVRAPTTGNYLTIPENGFVWMAWSSAGETPESAGAYALAFMNELKVGDIVNFVGVDFANHTTETDAYAEVWVDPNAPVNIALNKDYTISGTADSTYNADLTDGNAYAGMSYDNKWFVFNTGSTVDGIGTAIIDLAGDYVISKVQVNLINESVSGVAKPEYVKFYVSADNETWTELGEVALQDVQSAAYWTGIEDLDVTARYVKLEMKIGNPFSFLNEIEVYGKAAPAKVELVEGENNITVPALNSAIANTNFDKDYVITIAGQWDVTVIVNGVEYYPNRMGNLEAPLPAGENTVEFKNSAEEDAAIVAVVAAPIVGDTMDDPIVIDKDGDYTAEVNDKFTQGVFYEYVATEDGTVTITITTEAGWTYVINNVTAGKYGDMHWSDDETVVATETIEVTAGDVIQINVSTYDPENPWSLVEGSVNFSLDVPGEAAPETVEIALGDINMDGAVDQYDYILVRRQYFETIELNEVQLELADVNGDETVDQYDYILVCRHYFETFVIEGTVAVPVEALPAE